MAREQPTIRPQTHTPSIMPSAPELLQNYSVDRTLLSLPLSGCRKDSASTGTGLNDYGCTRLKVQETCIVTFVSRKELSTCTLTMPTFLGG
jgi:hypothetical protein